MTVFERLVRAAQRGTGLRLSPEDVRALHQFASDAFDDAARNDAARPVRKVRHEDT